MRPLSSSSDSPITSTTSPKWIFALAPACALGALAVVFWGQPLSAPIQFTGTALTETIPVLPVSQTLVIGSGATEQPLVLHGRLAVFNPQKIGAPTAGMVARLLVKPGQMVKAGDIIAMISNQAVPAIEKSRIEAQQRAEEAQAAATRQQNILQGKLHQEEELLNTANQRVKNAAKRLADARELLRRLQNGEKIPRSEINDADAIAQPEKPATPDSQETPDTSAAILAEAQQQANQAAKIAAQKWQILHVLLMRQQAAKSNANSNSAPTQEQIDAARADAKSAQAAADEARMKVFKLSTAKPALANKTKPADTSKSTFITQADATRIANAALQESKDALAQVDAIQKQIQRYKAPVKSATTNFEAATSNLENTQRSLFNNPVKVPMIPVIASAPGVVQTLATLATQVTAGEEVAGIVPPNLLQLELRDSSGLWKNLQPNAKFTVQVQPTSNPQNTVPTDARLISITPPKRPGEPSILHIQVFNPVQQSQITAPIMPATETDPAKPQARPRVFAPGMMASCALPRLDVKIIIPRSALYINSNQQYQVAVLKPQNPTSSLPQSCSIQWNNVIIQEDDGKSANVVIISGLSAGDRIALQPEVLYNLTQAKGSLATVKVDHS